ncbi:uncharacterized protein DUF4252 [Mesonia algae]|uniref:Uncharacterized protein DUF4252 n=1 Tax=Mesonia algae TaxID=213248 RepID=A0A2W7IG65_9FLAO|nr:DUF4252 domain-containing protein [Mesonia algae]PZW37763.1 uncharacterized protein DUF4252 [Mesonia algae]
MKKSIILVLAIMLAPIFSNAQSKFERYEKMRDVNAMVITSNMFKLLAEIDLDSDDPEMQQYINLIENLKDIKVISTENTSIGAEMKKDFDSHINSGSLEKLMSFKDDNKNVQFYSKPGSKKNFVSQLMMLMQGSEDGKPITVVLSITGDIDLKEVSKLAKDLEVPGAEELEKVN